MIRQPLVVVMGNVDSGKTATLDKIRRTAVVKSEAGAITQMISSSSISTDTIKRICGKLLEDKDIKIPGIVFIDTPGHAAFSSLRKRGGSLADIAILVIDVNEGIKPQTEECIDILRQQKTPFIIALNKIDLIRGWQSHKDTPLLKDISMQSQEVQKALDEKLYEVVGKIYELGFQAERFDRVSDYTRQVAIIPSSAETGEGVPELLMVLIGLAQKFLESELETDLEKPGRGTLLEVKEEKGLGLTLDAIIYDGKIKKNDVIVIGNIGEPIVTKVRSIFIPEKNKLKPIAEAKAAAGIKILASDIKGAIPGMPLAVAGSDLEKTKKEVQEEVDEVVIETENSGVIAKADSIGSLEALITMLKEKNIPIKKASIGEITKKDITDAEDSNRLHRVILGFNIKPVESTADIKIITHDVIYRIIEDYEKWVEEETERERQEKLKELPRPAKIMLLRGCMFRQSNPCVIGVEVLAGKLRADSMLIKPDGSVVGKIKSMQLEGENIQEAEKGKQVAISLPDVTGGRQIKEGDFLMVDITEDEFRELKKYKKFLGNEEIELLKELAEIKRKEKPLWGI